MERRRGISNPAFRHAANETWRAERECDTLNHAHSDATNTPNNISLNTQMSLTTDENIY